MIIAGHKTKKCAICGDQFVLFRTLQKVCSPVCAREYARQQTAKKTKREASKAKRERRANDRGYRQQKAQEWFNRYIRIADRHLPCISCGKMPAASDVQTLGGAWDCGHYLTVGGHPELRFCELNAHKQCKKCNGGSGRFTRKARTVAQDYRDNLIERIGLELVEWLEGPHEPLNLTAADLFSIERYYKQKIKEIKDNAQFRREYQPEQIAAIFGKR